MADRKGYMVVETTNLANSVCFSLQHTKDVENGSIVGKGDLIAGEKSVYTALDDYTTGMFLVANPAIKYDVYRPEDTNEEAYICPANKAFRAYKLGKDMKFKVYNLDLATPFVKGNGVKFEGGKFVKDDGGSPKMKVVDVEDVGFAFCVGEAGVQMTNYGYALDTSVKKYTIEVIA